MPEPMIATETRDIIAKWAAREVECPDCVLIEDKEGWGSVCKCKGTGTVAKFPMLRVECPKYCGCKNRPIPDDALIHPPRLFCKGSGWVIPPQDQWLKLGIEIALEQGFGVFIYPKNFHIGNPQSVALVPSNGDDPPYAPTLWRALDHALTAQEKI